MDRVKIDSVTMDYIQALHFDIAGFKMIIKDVISNNNNDFDKELLQYYIDDFKNTNRLYELIKLETIRLYRPEWDGLSVMFDFLSSEIYLQETHTCEGGSCHAR